MTNKTLKNIRTQKTQHGQIPGWELIMEFKEGNHHFPTIGQAVVLKENMSAVELSSRLHELAERIKHLDDIKSAEDVRHDIKVLDYTEKKSPLAFLALRKFITNTQDRPDVIKILLTVDFEENFSDINKMLIALGNPYIISEKRPRYHALLKINTGKANDSKTVGL